MKKSKDSLDKSSIRQILTVVIVLCFGISLGQYFFNRYLNDRLTQVARVESSLMSNPTASVTTKTLPYEKVDSACDDFSAEKIEYPLYWKGIDVNDNGVDVLMEGDIPELYELQYLDWGQFNKGSLTIQSVPSASFPIYELPFDGCGFVSHNDEYYYSCASWFLTVPYDGLVSTKCSINNCEIQASKCLFPDYVGLVWESAMQSEALCVWSDSKFCDEKQYKEFVYNYYKFLDL